MSKHYCYILRCADNTLYTGYTTDPKRREKEHNEGTGFESKYTKSRRPCKIVHLEEFDTKSEAMAREYYIKHHMSKREKEELIVPGGR